MSNFNDTAPPGAPLLYTSWADYPVRNFSYSMAADVAKCGAYTKFTRFQGLAPALENATFKFGICSEKAVMEFYRLGADPVETFRSEWLKFEKIRLNYTSRDSSWSNLEYVGVKLMKAFLREKDRLPIHNPEFGVVLPVDLNNIWYNGTRLEYIADVISHPLDGDMLIDIKTSGASYAEKDDTIGYAALDPQLLTGSLVSGIRRVGFLALIKQKEPKIQFVQGIVTDEILADHDLWLKEQYHKLIERRLHRRTGVRWPNDTCKLCDFLPVCLGNDKLAKETLRQKQSKKTVESLAVLDDL